MPFSNKQQATKFRALLLESLETRQLMASDLDATSQDLLLRSMDPVQSASHPTRNFASFGAQRLSALDPDSLDAIQSARIDRISTQSKKNFAPNSDLNTFRSRVPSQAQLQNALIGFSTTPRLDPNALNSGSTVSTASLSSTSPDAISISNGSFLTGILAPEGRSSLLRSTATSQQSTQQWLGGYCEEDGIEVFPSLHSATSIAAIRPEGEGPGGDGDVNNDNESIVPNVEFPDLESSSHSGSFDAFAPPNQNTSSTLTTFGSFTPASLTNPDLTLPGLHWVHLVDRFWVSDTQWSFTESLFLSFDLESLVEEQGGSTGNGNDGPAAEGDTPAGSTEGDNDNGNDGLQVESTWESSMEASRSGFFMFTFKASRGITTPSAAGVAWSIWVDYLDSVDFSGEASGGSEFTPSAAVQGGAGSSGATDDDSLTTSEGGQDDLPTYPEDFTASSNWNTSADLFVSSSGVVRISSIPSIASDNIVERNVSASVVYGVDGDIEVSEDWSSRSQSGNINLPDFPSDPGDNPLSICGDEIFDDKPDSEPNPDGDDPWLIIDPSNPSNITIDPSPLGEVEGTGQASMSNGTSMKKAGGGLSGSFGLDGILRGGRFSSLVGSALSELDTAKESSGGGTHLFVFRDSTVTPVPSGQSLTTLVLTAGWRGKGDANGDAESNGDIDLSLDADGVPTSQNDSFGELEGPGHTNGKDFIDLRLDESVVRAWNGGGVTEYGPYTHETTETNTLTLTYRSENKGKSLGDVYGFANAVDVSADFDSDLDGSGKSVLLVKSTFDNTDNSDGFGSTGEYAEDRNDHRVTTELYTSSYKISGEATGERVDDGPVVWTIDALVREDSDVQYDSVHDYFLQYSSTWNGPISPYWGYDYTRTAAFDAERSSGGTIVGGGSISSEAGGDTGGITTTDWKARSGDEVVSITVVGIAVPTAYQKTDLEVLLEAMYRNDDAEYGSNGEGNGTGGSQGNTDIVSYSGAGSSGDSVWWAAVKGVGQGACNLVNGVQDSAVGVANLAIAVPNTIAGTIDYAFGVTDPHYQIRVPYITSPDWSRNLITEEGGTAGGWDDSHGWSKWLAGEGAMSLLTAGASKAASVVDEAGQCANWLAKFVKGGCFVAGTLVTVCEMPYSEARETALWSETDWLDEPLNFGLREEHEVSQISTINAKRLLIPIEQVPIGARVPTKNPRPWEYDDSLPDPVQCEWSKISITLHRNEGGIVDAELIRPRSWMKQHGIRTNLMLPINIPELEVTGLAFVTSIDECPEIAIGDGSVITGRFLTRQVNTIIRAKILGPDGSIETIEGTPVHPIWSIDRNDWVALGELHEGEILRSSDGSAIIISISMLQTAVAVHNVEVHGEHVYAVGFCGLLVHNASECFRVVNEAEYVGAHIGKWANNVEDLDWAGYKFVWGNIDEAESWLSFLKSNGDNESFITKIETLKDITSYQWFRHPPQGIARIVPLDDLGVAARLFQ